jgi:hypothetical protein
MQHTRELHIVSGELNILKRSLSPLYSMINALRDHRPSPKRSGYFNPDNGSGRNTPAASPQPPPAPSVEYDDKPRGAEISPAARVYLADVADHVLILTEEVDMLRGTVENTINMVPQYRIHKLTIDFQYCSINTKRVNETVDHGVADLPTPDLHHGIFWYELQSGVLASSQQ